METRGESPARGARAAVERWSAAPVVFLHRLPKVVLLAAVFGLLVAGMAGTGAVAAASLLVLAVLLGWFAYLNWPRLDVPGRALRAGAVTLLALLAAGRALGRF